jgi:1,4-dihydroxy-2-naphthoate octaprenyltransferase
MRMLRGLWLELRVVPVLLWSYGALTLGTALAWHAGAPRDLRLWAAAVGLGLIIQGILAHTVNEIEDWRSGTDRSPSPRIISGGSKTIRLGLLSPRALWAFYAAGLAVAAAVGLLIAARHGWVLAVIGLGAVIGATLYTLPPVRAAYRPFIGESIAFACIVLCVVGAYRLQGPTPGPLAVAVACAVAAYAVGMLMMHHYLDHDADAAADPPKITSIVRLGRVRGRRYATAWSGVAALLAVGSTVAEVRLLPLAVAYVLALPVHARCDPFDVESVTHSELRVILLGIAGTLVSSVVLAPVLIVAVVVAVALVLVERLLAPSPEALLAPPDPEAKEISHA